MLTFQTFLKEEAEAKHAVLAYGRMNPPTTGHLKVIDKVIDVAKKVDGEHHMVVSHTNEPKKNPLSAEQKVKHLRRYAMNANIKAASKENPTIFSHAAELHKQGVTHLHIVAGSDRVDEYKKKFKELNGKPNKDGKVPFHFKKVTVHSSGERDPDSEGDEGMSGTKMREHAKNNDFKSFRKGVPRHVSDNDAKELMNDVRKGMGHTD
jgi:phosphopantetheine adenylyltransferase